MVSKKPHVDRLVDVLKQVDDGEYVKVDEHGFVTDGYWDREPLEGALATAFPDVDGLVIKPLVESSKALFLRQAWLSGTAEDGTKVAVEQTVGGPLLLFRMTKPDGTVILHSLNVSTLLQQWANWVEVS